MQTECQAALLQKQVNINAEHISQTQLLLTRHQKERHDLNFIPMPSENQREKSRQDMENRHQNELLDLQEIQNREKIEAMQEMLAGISLAQSESHEGHKHQTHQDAAAVTDQHNQIIDSTTDHKRPKRERNASPNDDSVPTTVLHTKLDSIDSSKSELASRSPPNKPIDRATLDAQKLAEIKALMHDKNLDREERRKKLDEIKNKYTKLSSQIPESNTTANSVHQRKIELQAIMKDRSLSKEERLKKLNEVRKKYPLEQGHRRSTTDDAPRKKVGSTKKYGRGMSLPVETTAGHNKDIKRASRSRDKNTNKSSSRHSEDRELRRVEDIPDHTDNHKRLSQASCSSNSARSGGSDLGGNINGSTAMSFENSFHGEEMMMSKDASSTQEDTVSSEEGDCVAELSESFKSRRRSSQDDNMHDDDGMDIRSESLKGAQLESGPPSNILNSVPKLNRKNSSGSQSKSVTISEPSSANTSSRSLKTDPLENAEVNKTPIKTLIRKLGKNDPSITVLKLDGRGKIKEGDWETFFETLENNTTLTHLSLGRCGLTDDLVVGLILALVENVTITSLHLKSNKDVTESKCCCCRGYHGIE